MSAVKNGQLILEVSLENFFKQMFQKISHPNFFIGTLILKRKLDFTLQTATIWEGLIIKIQNMKI